MILVTGGLGFIGTHTTRALLDLGESCVLVQRRAAAAPEVFASDVGRRVFIEQADITDLPGLLEIGKRHTITGIVHLAGSVPWPPGADQPVDGARKALGGLLNVFQAACDWQVTRIGAASTIGVYGGVTQAPPYSEDMPLPMTAAHAIPAFKKIGELLADYLTGETGAPIVSYRIAGIWGPLGRQASPFFGAPQLVQAAVRGTKPDLSALRSPAYSGDGIDLCYVKDCARAIAMLQVAPRLCHRTYNVGSGRVTSYGELAAAIRQAIPSAQIELPAGRAPGGPPHDFCLDISRLRSDTGYRPAYGTGRAAADYIAWLAGGHSH
jgi:UDP-glucose 4-epimerase